MFCNKLNNQPAVIANEFLVLIARFFYIQNSPLIVRYNVNDISLDFIFCYTSNRNVRIILFH